MPHVQKMHDRYKDRGLLLLAISYEEKNVLQPFLTANSYTMPVGSDPSRKVIDAFHIRGWPSSFLIDKEGKIAFVGGPYSVEPAIEKVLGLESSPQSLLDLYLKALGAKKPAAIRDTLTRLTEKAPADFDLRAWAAARGGVLVESNKPSKIAAEKVFARCVAATARKDEKERKKHLDLLAAAGPESFDLSIWARRTFGKSFPIKAGEFKKLLGGKQHAAAIEALMTRAPSSAILAAASKNSALKSHCETKLASEKTFAKKGIMARGWVFSGRTPRNNDGFWKELSVSGMQMSKDRKRVVGILLGGSTVTTSQVDGFIADSLRRAFLMKAIADGRKPKMARMEKAVRAEEKKILRDLEGRYGSTTKKN